MEFIYSLIISTVLFTFNEKQFNDLDEYLRIIGCFLMGFLGAMNGHPYSINWGASLPGYGLTSGLLTAILYVIIWNALLRLIKTNTIFVY